MYPRLSSVLLCLILPCCVLAEAPASKPHAVVIGIASYTDPAIIPRPHAEQDAKALYELLTDKDRFGVDAEHGRLLLGKEATRQKILDALAWLRGSAKSSDPVIVAFFGAGAPREGKGGRCYFASDSTVKGRDRDAVSSDDVAAEMDKLKSQRACFFLDVNFKAIRGDTPPEVSLGDSPFKEWIGADETPEHAPLPGRILFLATNGLTPSVDLKEHSLFAQVLLDGLRGGADREGYEGDGVVTTEELTKWLDSEMPRVRREKAPMAKRTPHFVIGSQGSRFVLIQEPKARAGIRSQISKLNALGKDNKLTEDLLREGIALLERMPGQKPRQDLRKQYQALASGSLTPKELQAARAKILEALRIEEEAVDRFGTRVLEAAALAQEHYIKELELPTLIAGAVRGLYRRLDEPMPKDIADQLKGVAKLSKEELKALLSSVRTSLGKREDLADHKDIDIALQRMLAPLDPYTTYIGPAEKTRFDIELRANYSGIGATVRKDEDTDLVRIISPIRGGPALLAGVQAGDLIEKVIRHVDSNGKELDQPEILETRDMTINDVVKKLLGKAGTKVTVSLRRPGKDKPIEMEIQRGRVMQETVFGYKRLPDLTWDHMIDPDRKIGYVRLSSFAPSSGADLKAAVDKLRKDGMKSLVLDLRFNPGGLLPMARDISDLFIDDQLIVSIRPRAGRGQRILGKKEGSLTDFPMVCLVNGSSASASEIVSACLQDHERAKVCGQRSYGKGSVQNVADFDGGSLKLTIATFWRPSGKNLNKLSTGGKDEDEWGVKPDKGLELVLSPSETDALADALREREVIRKDGKEPKPVKDRQLEMALEHLRK